MTRYVFENNFEEVNFFKVLKPLLLWPLIYHSQIYQIEKNIPDGGYRAVKAHYKIELSKINSFFNDNKDFYRYYRTQNNSLDNIYFRRGKTDIILIGDSYEFEFDDKYSTTYSYKISKILANERLVEFIEAKIRSLNDDLEQLSNKKGHLIPMHWSFGKSALVELIYALDSIGALDNGNAQLKNIAYNFSLLFQTDLKDIYRIYSQLKLRKIEKTKFIDNLKTAYVRRLETE
ncbi:MAG TPA: tetracycline regulation of excision, RteC [Chryseobacterium sp.]|nr:tetracycline regulation of excision, RteC [Chryseobacterium sp.]